MLVELKDVEVFIEPDEILTKAIDEGDLTIDQIIQTCRIEEGVESILDAVDNDDILHYVQEYDLDIEINMYDRVKRAVAEFTQSDRANLLWHLLKCEEA